MNSRRHGAIVALVVAAGLCATALAGLLAERYLSDEWTETVAFGVFAVVCVLVLITAARLPATASNIRFDDTPVRLSWGRQLGSASCVAAEIQDQFLFARLLVAIRACPMDKAGRHGVGVEDDQGAFLAIADRAGAKDPRWPNAKIVVVSDVTAPEDVFARGTPCARPVVLAAVVIYRRGAILCTELHALSTDHVCECAREVWRLLADATRSGDPGPTVRFAPNGVCHVTVPPPVEPERLESTRKAFEAMLGELRIRARVKFGD